MSVPAETWPGERRVALVPSGLTQLTSAGLRVVVEPASTTSSSYLDRTQMLFGDAKDVVGELVDELLRLGTSRAA